MKNAQQVTLGLLGLALVFLLFVIGGYGIHLATYQPALYKPPPEHERKGSVQMVREASNLEGLKRVCEFWAESQDRSSAFLEFQLKQFEWVMKLVALTLAFLGAVFAVGLFYVHRTLRHEAVAHAKQLP